jgi:hypothetical protein
MNRSKLKSGLSRSFLAAAVLATGMTSGIVACDNKSDSSAAPASASAPQAKGQPVAQGAAPTSNANSLSANSVKSASSTNTTSVLMGINDASIPQISGSVVTDLQVFRDAISNFVYSKKIWDTHWISDPDLVGMGLYIDRKSDQKVGSELSALLDSQGPASLELLKYAVKYATKKHTWSFYHDGNSPNKRLTHARYFLGVLNELNQQNHQQLAKVTVAELEKHIDQRDPAKSYTDYKFE